MSDEYAEMEKREAEEREASLKAQKDNQSDDSSHVDTELAPDDSLEPWDMYFSHNPREPELMVPPQIVEQVGLKDALFRTFSVDEDQLTIQEDREKGGEDWERPYWCNRVSN